MSTISEQQKIHSSANNNRQREKEKGERRGRREGREGRGSIYRNGNSLDSSKSVESVAHSQNIKRETASSICVKSPATRQSKLKRANWLQRQTVTKGFRVAVEKRYPSLSLDPAYWHTLEYLLFHKGAAHWDEETDTLLLPYWLLALFSGIDPADKNAVSNFNSGDYLDRFRRDVLTDLMVKDHVYTAEKKECRTVVGTGIDADIIELRDEELSRNITLKEYQRERVYFASGNRFRPDAKQKARAVELAEAKALRAGLDETPEQKVILDYLNELPPNVFTSLLAANYDAAKEIVNAIEDKGTRSANQTIMRRIADVGAPVYRPITNSFRVYDIQAGMQQLIRPARKALLRGCYEADGDAMHIAIMAKAWGVESLQEILRHGGGVRFWVELLEAMTGHEFVIGSESYKAHKDVIKHAAVYPLGYGSGDEKLVEGFERDDTARLFGDPVDAVRRLHSVPFMRDLYEARERVKAEIIASKGIDSPLGRVRMQKGRGPLTVLAMANAAYEVKLIASLFDAARGQSDFKVILYLFDGVVIKSTDASKGAGVRS